MQGQESGKGMPAAGMANREWRETKSDCKKFDRILTDDFSKSISLQESGSFTLGERSTRSQFESIGEMKWDERDRKGNGVQVGDSILI